MLPMALFVGHVLGVVIVGLLRSHLITQVCRNPYTSSSHWPAAGPDIVLGGMFGAESAAVSKSPSTRSACLGPSTTSSRPPSALNPRRPPPCAPLGGKGIQAYR